MDITVDIESLFDDSSNACKNDLVLADAGCIYRSCFEVWCKTTTRTLVEPILSDSADYNSFKSFVKDAILAELDNISGSKDVMMCIDSTSWRYKYYQDYKAGRSMSNGGVEVDKDAYRKLIDEVSDELADNGVKSVKIDKAEADDIIAVSAQTIGSNYDNVIIWSVDKDFNQLVNRNNVVRYDTISHRLFVPAVVKPELVSKFSGMQVQQVDAVESILSKIISGDKSDNIDSILKTTTNIGDAGAKKIIGLLTDKDYVGDRDAFKANLISEACTYKKVDEGTYGKAVSDKIDLNIKLMSLNINDIDSDIVDTIKENVSGIEFKKYSHTKKAVAEEDYDFFND